MSVLFKNVENQFNKQLPFVCYCKPNSEKIIALLQKNDALISLSESKIGFAFVSFNNLKRYLIPENQSDIYFETISNLDYVFENKCNFETDDATKNSFEILVSKAIQAIENREFEKVVLSRKEAVEIKKIDFITIFKKLLFFYPTAFKYCFYHPKIGFWMAASPEQFLKIDGNSITTVALAGTQTFSEKINWNPKEIREQKIVTHFIVKNLKKHACQVTFSEPYTFAAGNLVHIRTDIKAKLNDKNDVSSLIDLLHPTPAVCGFPKEKAKQFIVENEGYERTFYSGFFGEWNKNFLTNKENSFDLFVNLRCLEIQTNYMNLFVGCGITKDSNPEKEFIETQNKSLIIKNAI